MTIAQWRRAQAGGARAEQRAGRPARGAAGARAACWPVQLKNVTTPASTNAPAHTASRLTQARRSTLSPQRS